jgi:hypothetical protein
MPATADMIAAVSPDRGTLRKPQLSMFLDG